MNYIPKPTQPSDRVLQQQQLEQLQQQSLLRASNDYDQQAVRTSNPALGEVYLKQSKSQLQF